MTDLIDNAKAWVKEYDSMSFQDRQRSPHSDLSFSVEIIRSFIAEMMKEEDAKRVDWLESQASIGRFEIARSLLGGGYEFGFWPLSGPRAEVYDGSLREAIDKAMLASKPKEKE